MRALRIADDLQPAETSSSSVQDAETDGLDDHVYHREPNIRAIRHYLLTNPRRHLAGLTTSQKTIVARQAQQFRLEKGTMIFAHQNGKSLIYLETPQKRQDIMKDLHT